MQQILIINIIYFLSKEATGYDVAMAKNPNETREPITENVTLINYNDDNSCRIYNNYAERRICLGDSFFTKHDVEILFPIEVALEMNSNFIAEWGYGSGVMNVIDREMNSNFRAAWQYGPDSMNVIIRLPNNSHECFSYTDDSARTFHFNPDDATKCFREIINSNTTPEKVRKREATGYDVSMTKNLNEMRKPITANVAPINYNDDNSCRYNYDNYERRICFAEEFSAKLDVETLLPTNNDNIRQRPEEEKPKLVILATVVSGEGDHSQKVLNEAARETNLNYRAAWKCGPEVTHVILRLPNNSYKCYSYTDGHARIYRLNPDVATEFCRRFINSNTTPENIDQSIKSLFPGTEECYESFKYEYLNPSRSTSSSVLIGWLVIAVAVILIFIAF